MTGDAAPDVTWEGPASRPQRLRDLRAQGHVLLVFSPTEAQLQALERDRDRLLDLRVVPAAVLDRSATASRAWPAGSACTSPSSPTRGTSSPRSSTRSTPRPAALRPRGSWWTARAACAPSTARACPRAATRGWSRPPWCSPRPARPCPAARAERRKRPPDDSRPPSTRAGAVVRAAGGGRLRRPARDARPPAAAPRARPRARTAWGSRGPRPARAGPGPRSAPPSR